MNCPRRALQRGQLAELVTFFENEVVEFGLRVIKTVEPGELITEYVGEYRSNENATRDIFYDAETTVFNDKMAGPPLDMEKIIENLKVAVLPREADRRFHEQGLEL